ncbi:MAG: phytanoyl-CoA dioxygenase family protein [Acidimicrobiales bacterium]|nr:phytanoyl-CoA dioxygenase family protein [Acidimicrobiales bacterium]
MDATVAAVDLDHFARTGWLVQRGIFDPATVTATTEAVDEVATWADAGDPAPGLHHWELTDHGPALARSEDLVSHHQGLRALITRGLLPSIAAALLGEDAVLFKEKVNYKQPGGAGFAPHQDATAYRFVDHHVSCMVPIDPATEASGCLWVASGSHDGPLPTDDGGRIDEGVVRGLDWEPVEVAPGDVLWFDSYTPHQSGTNTTDRPRRALYLTYNAASEGDQRERYYADKRAEFSTAGGTFGDERVRISITDDFLGRPVPGRE